MSKIFAVLVCLFLFSATSFSIYAIDSTTAATIKRPLLIQEKSRIESLKEKIASRTAVLKLKLEAFKNKQKAIIAERINTNLNAINQNQTNQMQKHLNTMTNILDKLETKVKQGSIDIKNTNAAEAAITSARASIATASAAASAQAQKDYTIVVTSETRIRIDAKTQRDKLHADLLDLRKLIVSAKQSVGNAIKVAKTEIKEEKEGTESGQQ